MSPAPASVSMARASSSWRSTPAWWTALHASPDVARRSTAGTACVWRGGAERWAAHRAPYEDRAPLEDRTPLGGRTPSTTKLTRQSSHTALPTREHSLQLMEMVCVGTPRPCHGAVTLTSRSGTARRYDAAVSAARFTRVNRPAAGPSSRAGHADALPRAPGQLIPDLALADVRFAVVDVETTGGSPTSAVLTEVAVATVVGGRCVERYDQLVDPGVPIPPFITDLTGISDATVTGAPVFAAVAPAIRDQLADRILVGHNLPFDVSFLDAAFRAAGHPPLDHLQVDTLPLARRLLSEPVANFRLATLARALELAHRPSHRALADVLATADLLHHLLGRLAESGVHRLPQLLAFCGPQRTVGQQG